MKLSHSFSDATHKLVSTSWILAFFFLQNLMVSSHSLSSKIIECITTLEKSKCYESYATDSTTAFQVLLHIVSSKWINYDDYKNVFGMTYALWKQGFTRHQLTRLFEIATKSSVHLDFVLHDIQAPQFRELMNHYWADLDQVVHDTVFGTLGYFWWTLKTITDRSIYTPDWLENYLKSSLLYHQKDLKKASYTILKDAQSKWYTKASLTIMKPPVHKLMVEDGSVSITNKDEVALYQSRNDYLVYQAISTTPYFLYVWTNTASTFIGTHKYKQAIISYTSNQARALRFENSENTSADLLIQDWDYKKIYIRGSDEDHKRRYDTANDYSEHEYDYTVNSFFESESGLSEISHLMTGNQDLIFRSPTVWTALVEWVSWSGKTNLIFHRIDYLLQELPDQFQAEHLWVFTPNDILAAYMQAALDATSFTFREHVTIRAFWSLHALPHPTQSTYQATDQACIDTQIHHITTTLSTSFSAWYTTLATTLFNTVQHAKKKLEKTHSSKPSLDQHVHRDWYTKDIVLLQSTLQELKKIDTTSDSKTPAQSISRLLETIYAVVYTTYKTDTDSLQIKQRYHDELFDTLIAELQDLIYTYQNQLTVPRIVNDSFQATSYTPDFQQLIQRLSATETILLQAVIETTIKKHIGSIVTYRSFQYVLIDEFQDFHPLALQLMHMLYGKSLILSGDFMQSAWYHDTSDLKRLWIDLVDHRQMRDNFRNTLETLQHAHSVFGEQASSLFLAERVIKRWPHPLQIQDSSSSTIVKHIHSLVETIPSKETVAVIYYDKQFATQVYEWHTTNAPDHALFPALDKKHHDELISWYYSRQVYFISYRESKGLEFDHVLLIDQQGLLESDLHYKKKLWYIGCTRAVKTLGFVS